MDLISANRQTDADLPAALSRDELLRRNGIFESFFEAEAPRLAEACHEMSRRFLAGGRLLAFGNGSAGMPAASSLYNTSKPRT